MSAGWHPGYYLYRGGVSRQRRIRGQTIDGGGFYHEVNNKYAASMAKKTCVVLLGILLLVTGLVPGCTGETGTAIPGETGPTLAKDGDTVKVHYTGMLADSTVFATSVGSEPLEFTIGEGKMIPDFEEAIVGMQAGDSKTVNIPAEQAYGPRRDGMVVAVARDELPEGLEPEVGQQLQSIRADGSIALVTVVNVTDTRIEVDTNHPLAGEDLTFEIELLEIM